MPNPSPTPFSTALQQAGFPPTNLPPPQSLLHFGSAPGDDLLCTTVLRELRNRNHKNIWMMTKFPELFARNLDADVLVSRDEKLVEITRQFGSKFILPIYTKHDWQHDAGDPIPPAHILTVMCHLAGLTGPITLRPYYTVDPALNDFGHYSSRQIALHTSGASAIMPMKNKEWLTERFQQIVDLLGDDFTFVQLGHPTDPPLKNVIDLRGKTTIPQAAAVIKNSLLFLGLVGFLMHLARALDRRSVIIYGGRELPSQSGYPCNINLTHPVPCSPCWRWNTCLLNHACMQEIQSETAIDAILQQLTRRDDPLETERQFIEQQIPPS